MRRRAGQNVKLGYRVKFLVEDDVVFWDGTEHPPVIEPKDLGEANTTITISVSDGTVTTSDSFVLTVTPSGGAAVLQLFLPLIVK